MDNYAKSVGAVVATMIAVVVGVSGCTARTTQPAPLSLTTLHNDNMQFHTSRAPVLAPGAECKAFTPQVRRAAELPPGAQTGPMEPGHGCWAVADNVVGILTTPTPFVKFWRRTYSDDDGTGLTALMVDNATAQLFERSIVDQRYYAVRIGSQWTAGLDSGVTKTACMLVVDTASTQPLLINLTQQVPHHDPTLTTVARQCDLSSAIAGAILDEQDPGGGSHG